MLPPFFGRPAAGKFNFLWDFKSISVNLILILKKQHKI